MPITRNFRFNRSLVITNVTMSIPTSLPRLLRNISSSRPCVQILPSRTFRLLIGSLTRKLDLHYRMRVTNLLCPRRPKRPPLRPNMVIFRYRMRSNTLVRLMLPRQGPRHRVMNGLPRRRKLARLKHACGRMNTTMRRIIRSKSPK